MTLGRRTTIALVLAVVTGLAACSSDDGATAPTGAATPTAASGAVPAHEDVVEVPLVRGSEYDRAVASFGAEEVDAAATVAAQVARIALADCVRWTTGDMDPRLTTLVTPELLARAQEELDRSPEYGRSTGVPSLLSHLPEDDGNGNALAADVLEGCDDSAPLRWIHGPPAVSARRGGEPGLMLSGAFVMNVRFGHTVVSAGQDWTFGLERGTDGWRLTDVAPVMANVNWAPALAD